MLQLYFLTVLVNLLSGLILSGNFISSRLSSIAPYIDFQSSRTYRLIIGCSAFLAGLINLFTAYPNDIPILNNLIPSLIGIAAGLLIVAMWFNSRSVLKQGEEADSENGSRILGILKRLESATGPYHAALGIASIISALLHAVFPKLLLI